MQVRCTWESEGSHLETTFTIILPTWKVLEEAE